MSHHIHPDIDFNEIEGLQCPNCKGYKVSEKNGMGTIHAFLGIMTLGLWFVVLAISSIIKAFSSEPNTKTEVKCQLCGYNWIHETKFSTPKD